MSFPRFLAGIALFGAMVVPLTVEAQAGVIGSDSAACAGGAGPVIDVSTEQRAYPPITSFEGKDALAY